MKNKDGKFKFKFYFKIDTPAFLKEITDCAIGGSANNMGVLFVPMNIFRNYLGEIAQRCAEINDPVLNRIMVDMNMYDLPPMLSKERAAIVKKVYKNEKHYLSHAHAQKLTGEDSRPRSSNTKK